MKPRSPVLGYNHNVRYATMLWHVQTEDSGVQNPHIFTHLFHDGTILASKKVDYDPASAVTAVQKLMQTQHKQMLRQLKSGAFDEKITERYGPIKRDASDATDATDGDRNVALDAAEDAAAPASAPTPAPAQAQARPRSAEDDRATVPDLGPMLSPPPARPPTSPANPQVIVSSAPPPDARPRPSLTPSRPAIAVSARSSSGTHPAPPTIGGRAAARSAPPPTIGSGRSGAAQTNRPTAEGVIVARPSVIVGKDTGNKQTADFWKTERRAPEPKFGGELISEKSLDEVILAYLSEDGTPKK